MARLDTSICHLDFLSRIRFPPKVGSYSSDMLINSQIRLMAHSVTETRWHLSNMKRSCWQEFPS
jgi:hypothetical protein